MKLNGSLAGLAAVLLTLPLLGACKQNGPDPKGRVEQELKSANIGDVNVDYDKDAKILHLKGAVDSAAEKAHAEEVAHRAVGTSGTVANELTVKGVNDKSADDMDGAIRKELNAKVNNDRALDSRDINFDVNNGVVTIKGEVRTAAEKSKVAEMAHGTANVKDVVNGLEINPKAGGTTATSATEPARHPDRDATTTTTRRK
jgi:hyperosmotically inducible protein